MSIYIIRIRSNPQWSHSKFSKIPRYCYEKSQDWTKIPKLCENTIKRWKWEHLMFTNIEKNILLRLYMTILCQSWGLLTNRMPLYTSLRFVRRWLKRLLLRLVLMLVSKSDYTIALIVRYLRCQTFRCQSYTYNQNFILFTTIKNPKIARQNPKSQVDPQIPKILGKNPKQWERC